MITSSLWSSNCLLGCRGSNGRGDEPRRAKLRTPAKAAPAQRRGLQRQQHLCMGRNSPWAHVGSSSPPLAGGSRAPARLHQRPAVDQHLVSTSGRQQSTTWARAGQEGPLGVGEEERLGRSGGGRRGWRRRWKTPRKKTGWFKVWTGGIKVHLPIFTWSEHIPQRLTFRNGGSTLFLHCTNISQKFMGKKRHCQPANRHRKIQIALVNNASSSTNKKKANR